jgi:hypothetical protein
MCSIGRTAPLATSAIRTDRPGTLEFADNVATMETTRRVIVAVGFHFMPECD